MIKSTDIVCGPIVLLVPTVNQTVYLKIIFRLGIQFAWIPPINI